MKAAMQTPNLPEVDEDGLLIDPRQWNEAVAETIAHQLGIDELSPDHWLVIYALRNYFERFTVAPAMNNICHQHGKDGLWVHNLFESCLNAWRISTICNSRASCLLIFCQFFLVFFRQLLNDFGCEWTRFDCHVRCQIHCGLCHLVGRIFTTRLGCFNHPPYSITFDGR